MARVALDNIADVSRQILLACGVLEEHAAIIVDTIVYAHRMGKHTHGIGRTPIYERKIREELLNPITPLEIVTDRAAVCCMDAHNGFGQVGAYYGVKKAMERARQYGIGLVLIRESNNFGTAGFFTNMAATAGQIGIVAANAAPAISAGGGTALLGTNPISVAFPTDNAKEPFVFDMAVTNAARGKVRLALQNGEEIPLGWAVDKNGQATTDPVKALEGAMLPMGGYKGIGLAMVVDLLAGMLSGAAFAGDVRNLNHPTDTAKSGCFILCMDPMAVMSESEYKEKIRYFTARVHENGGVLPGEHAMLRAAESGNMAELSEKQMADVNQLAERLGVTERLTVKTDVSVSQQDNK